MTDLIEVMPVESIKQHVISDAMCKPGSTGQVKTMLELPNAPEFNFAANGYWAALDIIREQRALAQQLAKALESAPHWNQHVGKLSHSYGGWFVSDRKAALDAARKAGLI